MRQDQARLTVGDTTTIVHRVLVPPGALVQPRPLPDSTIASLLGSPNITREGDSVRLAYTVTIWAPGKNTLTIPGVIVARLDGRIDTLPDARVALDVASTLPSGVPVARVEPRQARPWVARADASWLPWSVAAIVIGVVALVGWWDWRRRGPMPPPRQGAVAPKLTAAQIDTWIAAGEAHLAVIHLESALAGHAAAAEWLARVAAVRFAPEDSVELAPLAQEGLALLIAVDA